jgi:hypothetical protein
MLIKLVVWVLTRASLGMLFMSIAHAFHLIQ